MQQELCRAKQPSDEGWVRAGRAAFQVNLSGKELFLSCCPGSGAQTRRDIVGSSTPDAVTWLWEVLRWTWACSEHMRLMWTDVQMS